MRSLLAVVIGVALAVVPSATRISAANWASRDLLNGTDRLLVARALAEGRKSARFIIACDPLKTGNVVSELTLDAANVEKVIPKLGYVRAKIALDRLDAVMQDPDIQFINYLAENQFDYDLQGIQPGTSSDESSSLPPSVLPTPSNKTSSVNPFTGLRAMAVPQFLERHPTYDGRGVVVGLLEPADPLAPGLAKARSLDGHIIGKFAGYRVAEGPFDQEVNGGGHNVRLGWVDMRLIMHVRGGEFMYRGISYRAPHDGIFRFGVFTANNLWWTHFKNTSRTVSHRVAPATTFPVLWDDSRDEVWINTHQDGDFARERAIGNFHGVDDIGTLPLTRADWARHGYPLTGKITEETHFIIQTDATDHFIRFDFVGLDGHASMVAGSATGNGFFGGAFDGVAPGAQISIVDGYYPYFIEALDALAESKVDVISGSFILTPYRNADGVLNRIVDRIIRTYNIPITSAADNTGPTMQSVGMPSTASAAISVGGYVSAETARYDEGAVFPDLRGVLAWYSARGPANDGAMKPDIIAQTEWLTSNTPEAPLDRFRQTRYLPKGYQVGGGTSQAAPTAAGAIALLISAAKQTKLPYTAELIKRALTSSGQSLPYERFEIGGGLIDVPAAWSALQRLAANPPPHIEASAPVRTATSAQLILPNSGRGLYEREGWHAGMRGTRLIAYTLASDVAANAYTYVVRVIGDTTTFAAPHTITLSRAMSVALPVRVTPRTSGIHSAIVELVDERLHTVVDQRLCTIVAAERFSASNDYTIVHKGSVEHPGFQRYFFAVPHGTTALSVNAVVAKQGLASTFDPFSGKQFIVVRMPDGVQSPSTERYPPINEGLHWAQAFDKPMPGVWEVDLQNVNPGEFGATPTRAAPIPPTPYQLHVVAYNVTAQTVPQRLRSGIQVALVNQMAPVSLKSANIELARVKHIAVQIAPGQERSVTAFAVPAQTSQVFVRFARRFSGVDVRLYLFNCASNVAAKRELYYYQGMCVLASSANAQSGEEIATTDNPRSWPSALYPSRIVSAGRWVAVVDGVHLPGPLSVALEIGTVHNAPLSAISLTHALRSGERWTQTFPVPPPMHSRGSTVALLGLQAANVMTIWQQTNADLIVNMVKSKPKILHHFGSVWSAAVPLEKL